MKQFFKSKLFLFALGLTLVCCVLMGFNASTGRPSPVANAMGAVSAPMQAGASKAAGFFSNLFGYFYKYSSLQEENARLKEQLAEYQQMEQEYYEAISENGDLRKLTQLKTKHKDFDCEYAQIVSFSVNSYQSAFTINRGTADGVEVGDCVITDAGFVGYVREVGLNYAEVVTIMDTTSKVGARVSRTRETGVAEGNFELIDNGQLKLTYLQNDAEARAGDKIETSGYGGTYPKGLLIGEIVEVKPESHGVSSYAIVKPTVDVGSLSAVYVVKSFTVVD